jgi:Cu2+-exporting ATPase
MSEHHHEEHDHMAMDHHDPATHDMVQPSPAPAHSAHAEHGGGHSMDAMDHGQDHAGHGEHTAHEDHTGHVDHTGHELLFRNRFWISLALTIPVLLYTPMLQT